MPKHLAIAGGGTGGHIFPALAIAASLKGQRPELEITYLGTARSLEERLATQYGWPFRRITARPLERRLALRNLLTPLAVLWGSFKLQSWYGTNNIAAVLGTGGYVSVPALMAAKRSGRRIFLQEQNSFPGLATRMFAKAAARVFIAYPDATRHLPLGANTFAVGNPLRPGFGTVSREEGLKFFGLDASKATLLVFGGSQGSRALNEKVRLSLPSLAKVDRLQLIWQVGKGNLNDYLAPFVASGLPGLVLEFIEHMEMAYGAADLAFCRSGAISLAELAAAGLPAILVPYPQAAADHQYHNARVFEAGGAAVVVRQADLGRYDLGVAIATRLADRSGLRKMSEAARALADPQAPEKIARAILEDLKW